MKVLMAFLAHSAMAHNDGTISTLNGGIHGLGFTAFPARHEQLALACKIQFDVTEIDQDQTVSVRSLDPAGRMFQPLVGLGVVPKVVGNSSVAYFHFSYNMTNLRFETPGTYRFTISGTGGVSLNEIELRVDTIELPAPVEVGASQTLNGALQRGFNTFTQGKVEEAKAIFEGLAERFPESPDALNNLGFTELATRRVPEALNAFQLARERGYPLSEVVAANIATCHYLLGNYEQAVNDFLSLINQPLTSAGCVLFGLGSASYSLVNLVSSADFLALMALNASRSLLRANRTDEAIRMAQIAQVGTMTMSEASRVTLSTLISEAKEEIELATSGR
jgi:hypothetical protein